MNDLTHDLDQALDQVLGTTAEGWLGEGPMLLSGRLAYYAGCATMWSYRHMADSTRSCLAKTAAVAIAWTTDVTGTDLDDVTDRVRDEYDIAYLKHAGNTPLNPAMPDMHRAAILLEEVGEVARALTPDAHTPVGHAGNLADELIQTATMAAAWLQHEINKQETRS